MCIMCIWGTHVQCFSVRFRVLFPTIAHFFVLFSYSVYFFFIPSRGANKSLARLQFVDLILIFGRRSKQMIFYSCIRFGNFRVNCELCFISVFFVRASVYVRFSSALLCCLFCNSQDRIYRKVIKAAIWSATRTLLSNLSVARTSFLSGVPSRATMRSSIKVARVC